MPERSRRRWSFFVISALGLAASIWGMQGLAKLSALPPDFRTELLYPARVGRAVVGSPGDLRFVTQSRPIGSIVEIQSPDRTIRVRLVPQLTTLHYFLVLIEGLLFLAVNFVVFGPRVDRGPVRDLYWCTLLYGVAIMIGGVYFPRTASWTEAVLPLVWIACLAFLPVLFVRMTLTFPRRQRFMDRHPRLVRGLLLAAAILASAQAVALLHYFADPRPLAWQWVRVSRFLAEIFLVGAVGLGCLILYRGVRALELSREREQAKWLLWGFTIGVTPYVFLRTLPNILGLSSPFPPELDRVFELAIPVAFTFAVVRYRFLDIDIIIRRSLIYGILAGVLAGIYLLLGVLAGRELAERFPRYALMIQILAVAIPVALVSPTRRWIGAWVDRTFFKIQYNYAHALLAFQEAMHQASSQEEIAGVARRFLEAQLRVKRAVVATRRGCDPADGASLDWSDVETLFCSPASSPTPRRLRAAVNSTSRPELETEGLPEGLTREGIRLAAPLWSEGECVGAILLGEKTIEHRFIEEDLKLVHSVRSETEAALERVELIQVAAAEALEREKFQELERIKSDFFSRVAHDLRTPLTSIRWTVQNLLDGVGGSPHPKHVAQLKAIRSSADQLGRLVNNLLDLSRLEHPSAAVQCGPVDLVPLVEESVAALQATAGAREVRFRLSVAPGLGPVCGDRDRLQEVIANVLENAAKYSPDGAPVEISVDRLDGEGQILTVRDHGPGLLPEDFDRIFERFEQGRPSPYSKQRGFGLGLYVAKSYLTLMRGSIRAGNHPGGGARFECVLPEWKKGR